jgi:hypothetical protein
MQLYIHVFDMYMTKMMSNTPYSLPIIPLLQNLDEWQTSMRPEDDPLFVFTLPRHPPGWRRNDRATHKRRVRVKDPFVVRSQLFTIETPNQALAFFHEFGPMEIDDSDYRNQTASSVPFSWVAERRDFYRDALLTRPIKFVDENPDFDNDDEVFNNFHLWHNLSLDLLFQQPMKAIAYCKDVESALRASVFLDRLRGLPWRACARDDCNKPFELPPRRVKLYCSSECAHLQSVRNYNERQRTARAAKPRDKKGTSKTDGNLQAGRSVLV